jgi:hypothetical protein
MIASWKNPMSLALAALAVAVVAVTLCWQPAQAQRGKGRGGAAASRYTVVDTEGHNLIVTDNQTNTLYFYTIDRGAEIGSPLKLRGSIDLKEVGQPVITPKKANAKPEK